MAYSEGAPPQSYIAGTTFSSTDVYTGVVIASSQDGTVISPNTTGNVLVIGTLYGRTSTTSAAGVQAVPVKTEGKVKVRMAASTLAAGQSIGFSTSGLGIAPTTDAYVFGLIVAGSSGAAGRVVTVLKTGLGPLSTP